MKTLIPVLTAAGFLLSASSWAADLKESKFTQVVNDVQVVSTADNSKHAATVGALFKLPDVVRTGASSRAELVADDHTITRIGANTIFSFDTADRSIRLDQGSLLFNAPKGKGGGSVHTAAATAAVLGTTIIVSTTPNGGFKVLVLEGKAEVKFLKGLTRHLKAGQMVFVLPGSVPGPVVVFRLDEQVGGSQLVNGFDIPLPSLTLINNEITYQHHLIEIGRAQDTGLLVGSSATPTSVQVIQVFNETSAGPGASHGVVPGLNGSNPFSLPPGFVVPPGLTFDPLTGGFLTADGLKFIAATTPIENAAIPAAASLTDATISGSPLDPAHLFSDAVVALDTTGDHPGIGTTAFASGFIGRNITFEAQNVDMSPFAAQSVFSFVAAQQMFFDTSMSFTGSPAILQFISGSGFNFASDTFVSADSTLFSFSSPGSLDLEGGNLNDDNGTVFTSAGNDLTLNGTFLSGNNVAANSGTTMTLTGSGISANNVVSLSSGAAMNLNNTSVNGATIGLTSGGSMSVTSSSTDSGAINATSSANFIAKSGLTVGVNVTALTGSEPESGVINLQNSSGLATVNQNATFTSGFITVNSPGGILFDTTTVNASGTVNLTAGNVSGDLATVQNTTFTGAANVNISAHTVVLQSVDFAQGSLVSLKSFFGALAGGANTGQAVVTGDVNYISGVTYGGQNAVSFTGGQGPITIGKN